MPQGPVAFTVMTGTAGDAGYRGMLRMCTGDIRETATIGSGGEPAMAGVASCGCIRARHRGREVTEYRGAQTRNPCTSGHAGWGGIFSTNSRYIVAGTARAQNITGNAGSAIVAMCGSTAATVRQPDVWMGQARAGMAGFTAIGHGDPIGGGYGNIESGVAARHLCCVAG